MTFEDWFGTGHRLDDHDKQVAELMRMAWNMADKAARNECAEICERVCSGPHAVYKDGAQVCEELIRDTIK